MHPKSPKLLEEIGDAAELIRDVSKRARPWLNQVLVSSTIESHVPTLLRDVETLLASKQ